MKRAGRVADRSQAPHDMHGCPRCSHSVSGPATAGSVNVLINNRPALREGDTGVHDRCCDQNTWEVRQGALRVLINQRRAHRRGDATRHCGGDGRLVDGSPNVLIGDYVAKDAIRHQELRVVLKDAPGPIGVALAYVPWVLMLEFLVVERGESGADGSVTIMSTLLPGRLYELRYPGSTIELIGREAPIDTPRGIQIRLSFLGYDVGPPSGQIDERTRVALAHFRVDHQIDGGAPDDERTRAKLQEIAGF